MDVEKIRQVFEQTARLMELHRQADETMRKFIKVVTHQHLKENNISKTMEEWEQTEAALKIMMGEANRFRPDGYHHYPRSKWPTHIRLNDLTPVSIIIGDDQLIRTYSVRGIMLETLTSENFNEQHIKIRELDDVDHLLASSGFKVKTTKTEK